MGTMYVGEAAIYIDDDTGVVWDTPQKTKKMADSFEDFTAGKPPTDEPLITEEEIEEIVEEAVTETVEETVAEMQEEAAVPPQEPKDERPPLPEELPNPLVCDFPGCGFPAKTKSGLMLHKRKHGPMTP